MARHFIISNFNFILFRIGLKNILIFAAIYNLKNERFV